LGLLDLAVAITTGFLMSPSPLQMYSFDAPNELITAYPLVLVPVFGVPLAILLHAASLIKLGRETAHGLSPIGAQVYGLSVGTDQLRSGTDRTTDEFAPPRLSKG
jgi:hypothetical protein